jgi:uncharacterized membrane protein HdeD (DUF308 family)
MKDFFMGGIAMASLIVGLFFWKFWTKTHDRLFAMFAIGFWLLGVIRIGLSYTHDADESQYLYWVRLLAFGVILAAILDKNRPSRSAKGGDLRA